MAYLITGTRGELGFQIAEILTAKGSEVFSFDSERVCGSNDIVIHLAAKHPKSNLDELIDSNINYLRQVLTKSKDCKHFVFLSSSSVYGEDREGLVSENYRGREISTYGMTKLLGERLVKESGVDATCIRCPALLEIDSSKNYLSTLYETISSNQKVKIYNSDKPFNTFVSAEQIATFINSYLRKRFNIVNLAVNCDITLKRVVNTIKKELGSTSTIEYSDENKLHHNLNISKAENFGFINGNTDAILRKWCKRRKNVQ